MILHFFEVLARACLGAVGFRISERKLGTCGSCFCGVWESDDRIQIHGAWFHKDCATYVRRRAAA